MLVAYRERPTIKNVMAAGGVGKRVARRAVMEGWPDHSLPPFVELASAGTTVHREMARIRESWEEAATTQGEAARMAAEQAMAARTIMASAMRSSLLIENMLTDLLQRVQNGESLLPEEITPKVVNQLMGAQTKLADAVKRAIEIEKLRVGEPEAQLGIQIGIMLERCTDDELEIVVNTGHLPDRLLDQRRLVVASITEGDEEEGPAQQDEGEEPEDSTQVEAAVEATVEDEAFGLGLPDGLDFDDGEPESAVGS
jgi:hypothetical protein